MSTAICLPRCPHCVATKRFFACLVFLLPSLASFTTATESLYGRDLLDYRLVDPASHMQPWPADETDILIEPPAAVRIAKKWRTNLSGSSKPESASTTKVEALQAKNERSSPALQKTAIQPEVLSTPKTPEQDSQPLPENAPDCYQAQPLTAISTSISLPPGELPTNTAALCAAQMPPNGDRRLYGGWGCTEHHWSATCMHHRPLYFEEINAERYGYTVSYALQPVISAAKFFATIPALPYKMVVERPRDCIYTLGHYRPGSCVPRRHNRLPWNLGAGAVESGVIAGLILLIP